MKRLDERALVRETLRLFGPTTAARLIGWCALTAMQFGDAEPTRQALLARGWGSVATRYRNVHQLERLAEHCRAQGYRFDDPPASPEGVLMAAVA